MRELLDRQELRHILDETVRQVCARYKASSMKDSDAETVKDMILLSGQVDCCVRDVIGMAKAYQSAICYLEKIDEVVSGDLQKETRGNVEKIRTALLGLERTIIKCIQGEDDSRKMLRELKL